MNRARRKTAPKVVNGKVQRKNRWQPTPNNFGLSRVTIERRRAGYDYRHVLKREDVYRFVGLVPGWDKLAKGINKIILDEGDESRLGWFRPGTVAVCALGRDRRVTFAREYFYRDVDFFDRLGVAYEDAEDSVNVSAQERADDCGSIYCWFTPASARCFQLMRVLLHELGHHYDYVTSRKRWCSRGEDFAENYGQRLEQKIWQDYVKVFGDPVDRTKATMKK